MQHEERWDRSFKFEIPEFHGNQVAEELLDWIATVEEILEFKKVPLEHCVTVLAMRFRNRATACWTQLKTSRQRMGKAKIESWDKLKKHMRKMFLPYNYDQLMFQCLQHLRQGRRTVEEYSTEFFLLLNRIDLHDSDKQLVACFIGGLRQQIQFTLNMFSPLTLSEAHQQALTIEGQNMTTASPWYSTRQQRVPPASSASTSNTSPSTTNTETALVPVEVSRPARTGTLRCFSCGEPSHRMAACPTRNKRGLLLDTSGRDVEVVYDDTTDDETEELVADTCVSLMLRRSCLAPRSDEEFPQRNNLFHSRCTIEGKVCKLIIDSGSSENVIAEDAVKKLSLQDEHHHALYRLAWLQQTTDLLDTRRALDSFSIGDAYHDKVYCDVAPIDACHILLGLPWEIDRRVIHDGYLNTYTFKYNNRSFTLKPSPPPKPPAMREADLVFVLTATPASSPNDNETRPEFQEILQEFADVFPVRD